MYETTFKLKGSEAEDIIMELALTFCHLLFSIVLIFINLFVFGMNFQSLLFSFVIFLPLLSQLISQKKKTNFLYPRTVVDNPIKTAVVFSIIGAVPIILEYFSISSFPITVFLCNCIAAPILIGTFVDYIHRLDKNTEFINALYASNHENVIKITEIVSQLVFFYVVLYNRSQYDEIVHNIGNAINLIYQYAAMNIIVLTLIYLFLAIFTSDWRKAKFSETYPKGPIFAYLGFFLAWGSRAFFDTTNHIELSFLLSIIAYIIGVPLVTTLLISSYYDDYAHDETKCKELNGQIAKSLPETIVPVILMIPYCWLAFNYDAAKITKSTNTHPISEPMLLTLIVFCIALLIIVLISTFALMRKIGRK